MKGRRKPSRRRSAGGGASLPPRQTPFARLRAELAAAGRPLAAKPAEERKASVAPRRPGDEANELEIFGQGYALLPPPGEKAIALSVPSPRIPGGRTLLCTCSTTYQLRACEHMKRLGGRLERERGPGAAPGLLAAWAASAWQRLARELVGAEPAEWRSVRVSVDAEGKLSEAGPGELWFTSEAGAALVRIGPRGPMTERLLERLGQDVGRGAPLRALALDLLREAQESRDARVVNAFGFETLGQRLAKSFWGRFAYHAFRELGEPRALEPRIEADGRFALRHVSGPPGAPAALAVLYVPGAALERVLEECRDLLAPSPLLEAPLELGLRFRLRRAGPGRAEILPEVETRSEPEPLAVLGPALEAYRYGELVYLAGRGRLGRLPAGAPRLASEEVAIEDSELPLRLGDWETRFGPGAVAPDASLPELQVLRRFEALEVTAAQRHGEWLWLALGLRVEGSRIPVAALLEARKRGEAFLRSGSGLVDLGLEALDELERVRGREAPPGGRGSSLAARLALTPLELLRASALAAAPLEVAPDAVGDAEALGMLGRLAAGRPARPYRQPAGLSELRDYQIRGVEWLRFLFEEGLAGLLCDEMGLGKTHQVMAFLASLREDGVRESALIVSPTTVLSHWKAKLKAHAPGLHAVVLHGATRDVQAALGTADVLLTSYGVLRRDAELLARTTLGVVVFDEAQHLKNRASQSHQAARRLQARMKLGVTGTPLENQLQELKALFDLVLPGYFGSEERFERLYVGDDGGVRPERRDELRRLTAPFTLRRLKQQVLAELPDKIEDVRYCELSEEQVELYRRTVSRTAPEIERKLRARGIPVPYIHVFALIDRLKQLCDHPVLLADAPVSSYQRHASGKWDLFVELLEESLGSGQKVVVFSQYLGMLEIMSRHLAERGTEAVMLTGATRDRDAVLERFQRDPRCRVFLGSLKAGGTGIDLIAGSVVIHYDRWWNPAREDQATDRVHRIGQQRAVQVFKLVTEGTLEEKIDAIIERKRRLFAEVVEADDARLEKSFSREELLGLIESV